MSTLRDLSVWLPALEAQLRDAPGGVDLVEFDGVVSRGAIGGRRRMDGIADTSVQGTNQYGRELWGELSALAKRFDIKYVGVVLRSSRSGICEVELIEPPACVTHAPGGAVVRDLCLQDGALPALYRRLPDLTVTAAAAPSADPAALSRLIAQKLPNATPATSEQLAAAEAQLGVPLTDEVRAIYSTAGSGHIRLDNDAGFYGMELIPLDAIEDRSTYLPDAGRLSWWWAGIESLGPDPAGRIQTLALSRLWFPVGHDWGGNFYAADLAPAAHGHRGQVVYLDHEGAGQASYIAESFTELLVHGNESHFGGPVRDEGRAYIHDQSDIADAAEMLDLEVLCLRRSDCPVDLGPLLDHPQVRAIDAATGTLVDPLQLTLFPALEYLSIGIAEWRILLDTNRVPRQLLAAGICEDDTDVAATITTANDILRLWGRPLIEMTRLAGRLPTRRFQFPWGRR
ncbi:SMI1/KNR4 family protein [Mycobacteroides immunogenum]|uniref:SMI1/KNR4 family protein n=1 Tax=Mycobacteroides immunogenum TaxID=83262 RepID=UPI0025B76A59|nr:SMI1/KNR4 family protein [Mycobacteroides immunogenum]WJR36107.1 SMI1/KNR4 family protein [Mycobacteroides immunogenum]